MPALIRELERRLSAMLPIQKLAPGSTVGHIYIENGEIVYQDASERTYSLYWWAAPSGGINVRAFFGSRVIATWSDLDMDRAFETVVAEVSAMLRISESSAS